MLYATIGSGKRLRPLLCLAVASDYGNSRSALPPACAIELLHSYSLVHDDLPSMDDDALRRGKPACHIRFGEATALLAGDGLQALAYAELAKAKLGDAAIAELARASGWQGMVGGQALDLAKQATNLKALQEMHFRKTGALFVAAARLGAMSAGIAARKLRVPTNFAQAFGLLFQIANDIADEVTPAKVSGKKRGSDQDRKRATYLTVLGMDEARRQLHYTWQNVRGKLSSFPVGRNRTRELCAWIFPTLVGKQS